MFADKPRNGSATKVSGCKLRVALEIAPAAYYRGDFRENRLYSMLWIEFWTQLWICNLQLSLEVTFLLHKVKQHWTFIHKHDESIHRAMPSL